MSVCQPAPPNSLPCTLCWFNNNNDNNGLDLYSAFQGTKSALQFHYSFTLAFTHWWRQATVVATAALGQTDRSKAAISRHRLLWPSPVGGRVKCLAQGHKDQDREPGNRTGSVTDTLPNPLSHGRPTTLVCLF